MIILSIFALRIYKDIRTCILINPSFDLGSITAFHSGIFATFYFCTAYAIWVYYRHIRGDVALSLESAASGLCHVLIYISSLITPPSPHLHYAIACYCCCASPTILLCIRESVQPGWISWKRYFQYIGPFLVGTVLAGIFASEYIFYILLVADFCFCCYATYRLINGINTHEKLIKQYYAEVEGYSHNWVRVFVYIQVANVVVFFLLYQHFSEVFNILFNYFQAFYWLYFLLMCKKYRYYSRQIPNEYKGVLDADAESEIGTAYSKVENKDNTEERTIISNETVELIETRLLELEAEKFYLNDSLNLAVLSQLVHTNRTYMNLYFRMQNTTFWDFINRHRCDYAVSVMKKHPTITVPELAQTCGYRTDSCFRSSFTTIYGMTPNAYRKELLKAQEQ